MKGQLRRDRGSRPLSRKATLEHQCNLRGNAGLGLFSKLRMRYCANFLVTSKLDTEVHSYNFYCNV